MTKYEIIDGLIVERLTIKPAMFAELLLGDILDECQTLASDSVSGEAFRVLDRRLQALRKSGVIVFNSKIGWMLK